MREAFLGITIKALDEDARRIEGWATRPEIDRVGDQVMPKGAVYKLPIPFLLDHNHLHAVGEVDRVEVSDAGIKFWAHIKRIAEPGEVKDLCDKAWSLIKNGLRKAVSIGFKPLRSERLDSGGLRFTGWEWLELSAVSVSAVRGAVITGAKDFRYGEKAVTVIPRDYEQEEADALRSSKAHVTMGTAMQMVDGLMHATKAHVSRRLDEVTGPLLDLVAEQAMQLGDLRARLDKIEGDQR